MTEIQIYTTEVLKNSEVILKIAPHFESMPP